MAPRRPAETPEPAETIAVPELLTQEEAIRLPRLDSLGLRDPRESLRYLRRARQIGCVKVAGKVLIPRDAIREYLEQNRVPPIP